MKIIYVVAVHMKLCRIKWMTLVPNTCIIQVVHCFIAIYLRSERRIVKQILQVEDLNE
jgi:hypothetical protein